MKKSYYVSLFLLGLLLVMVTPVFAASKNKKFSGADVQFSYPTNWGTLTEQSQKKDEDGVRLFTASYLKTMLPYKASSPTIKKVFFHKPTKTIAFVEHKGEQDILMIIKKNGSKMKLFSLENDENIALLDIILISPRGYFLFVQNPIDAGEDRVTYMFDIRKNPFQIKSGEAYDYLNVDVQRGIVFSKDATRMAIHTLQGSDIAGNGQPESMMVQNPKTLALEIIFTNRIKEDVPPSIEKKYGVGAFTSLGDPKFDAKGNLIFSRFVTAYDENGNRAVHKPILTYTYNFSSRSLTGL